MTSLKLLIADDHEIVRVGLRNLLEAQPGWSIVAEAANGRAAVEKAEATRPHIVVLDTGMPSLNGLEAARQIIKNVPGTKILFFTMNDSDVLIQEALELGVRGFVLKTDPAFDLLAAVQALRDNQTFFTPRVGQIVLDGFRRRISPDRSTSPRLTVRQREIVRLVADGKTTKEVALLLNLSVKTAETHRANIMCRLHCHSVVELVHYCIRNGIIDVGYEPIRQTAFSTHDPEAMMRASA